MSRCIPARYRPFDDVDGHRFTALLTTQQDTDLAALDRRHRAHARVRVSLNAKAAATLRHSLDTVARTMTPTGVATRGCSMP